MMSASDHLRLLTAEDTCFSLLGKTGEGDFVFCFGFCFIVEKRKYEIRIFVL